MSLNELRKYVLANRHDQEAWEEFTSRPRPDAVTFPYTENPQEIEDSLRDFLESKGKLGK
ncbi:MAG: DUF6887 family protein [Waterburya sp.]